MVPTGPIMCGNIIESPLFRALELSHHCIHGVCPETILCPAIVFHPSSLFISLVSHILAFSHTVSYPLWSRVSSCQVIHALKAIIRKVFSLLLNAPHSTIIPGVSLSVALLLSLMPYFLTYGGPPFVDNSLFIPEDRSRGRYTLVPASTLVRCLGSGKGTLHFPLT